MIYEEACSSKRFRFHQAQLPLGRIYMLCAIPDREVTSYEQLVLNWLSYNIPPRTFALVVGRSVQLGIAMRARQANVGERGDRMMICGERVCGEKKLYHSTWKDRRANLTRIQLSTEYPSDKTTFYACKVSVPHDFCLNDTLTHLIRHRFTQDITCDH